jgi:Zn-dependent M16 (insulinase) family peptidase
MIINEVINGFEIKNITELSDVKGTLYEMQHVKTGAKLAWLDRADENKTFAIAFKTIPENDTGVFHILEHSVLNGSKKYPVREPFVELLKGSMQTFLNAMTFPDKTLYPVSSRNDKDFMNLMSVYMDAVFHPAIYTNPNIFYQEGWHYEIRHEEDTPIYKGVVLNEMKGAFSSVDETIIDELNRMLFPDNCYQYVSGGDPEHITDLSYESFIETHQKFYHPSNARVWLDGTLDINEVTKFINDEYFSQYEKEEMDFSIPNQVEREAQHHTVQYELSKDESKEHRTQIALARIVSSYDQPLKNLAWGLLSTILVSSNESELKKAIIEQDLGEDVELDIYDGIQQPWIVMCVRNTDAEKYDEVMQAIKKCAEGLIENGLDHDAILATLNQLEFKYREKHEPAGVMFAQRALETWLYDGDITQGFSLNPVFKELRKKVDEGYFEELLKEFFLSDHLSTVVAVPSYTLSQERVEKEEAKLKEAKDSWKEDVSKYIALNQTLDNWQATADTEEQLATLPKLTKEDISKDPIVYPYEVIRKYGVDVVLHPAEDSGITYLNFYFNLAGITVDHLPSLGFLASLFTNLPTKNKTVEQIQSAIRKDLGGLSFFLDAYSPTGVHDSCIPLLGISASCLKENTEKAIDLMLEIAKETVFDPEKILPLLKQDNESFRQGLLANGQSIAMRRCAAHNSAEGVFREYVGGYESGIYEKNLEKNFEKEIDTFIQECELYQEVLFSKARCTASITGEDQLSFVEKFVDGLYNVDAQPAKMHYPLLKDKKEFIQITGGVSYSAINQNIEETGGKYSPKLNVLSHLLTYDYLWNEVRVKGGAYGTGFAVNQNGNIGAYSYRDPDVTNAINAYKHVYERVASLAASNEDLTQMIIGTIASSEPLLSPLSKVRVADRFYFTNVTYEDRKNNRKAIIETTGEELSTYADVFKKALDEGCICVVGNEETYTKLEGYTKLETI